MGLQSLMPQKQQKKARARSEKSGSYPVYTLIADPTKTYVRGKMPAWIFVDG